MKDIKINHQFTLKELLLRIKKIGMDSKTYDLAYVYMMHKINEYLEMIE